MGLAFALLRLPPEAFWACSPREFMALLRGLNGAGAVPPPTRAAFEALAARFPDAPPERGCHG